jgi:hypothetical protein
MRTIPAIIVLSVCLVCFVGSAKAAKVTISDDAFLDIHGFAQPWLYVPIDHEGKDPSIVTDFYLRRVRLLLGGQVAPNVKFFLGTLNCDMGKDGDMSSRTMIADAWVEFVLADCCRIDAGLLKLPFSRHMQQTGAKLHGIDFHGTFLNTCGGISHRDMGVMARGLLSEDRVDYRLAVLDGVEYEKVISPTDTVVINEDDMPRFVGRIAYNVFDSEPDYFWAGTYLGSKKVLTFGASFDVQPGVGGDEGDELYYALAIDAFADIPMGENGIVGTLSSYYFGPGGVVPEGQGLWADFGYRIKKTEPLVAVEWYEPKDGDMGKREVILLGLNEWIHGHNASVKLQFGVQRLNGADEWTKTAIAQTQVLF